MPKAVSRRQYNMMRAILEDKIRGDDCPRGCPPKYVAHKYVSDTEDIDKLPERSGKNSGGRWYHSESEERSDRFKKDDREDAVIVEDSKSSNEKKKSSRQEDNSSKDEKKINKALEDFYKGRAAAAIVLNPNGAILMGRHVTGKLAFAGGFFEDSDIGTETTALRELKEEMGIIGRNPQKIWSGKVNGNDTDVYIVESYIGKPTSTDEIKNPRFYSIQDIDWNDVRDCCIAPLKYILENKFGKSLSGMLALENLEKNIIRQKPDVVYEINHGDALKVVGNGLFRKLRNIVKDMNDEDFKEVTIDTYKLNIRKHMNDVYSGRVLDGHKLVYQFTNKSLPQLTAALMSVFEWYLPEDEKVLEILDDSSLSDDAIEGGLKSLIENYERYSIGNIYQEMETIRENIRNGVAVDLQQVENRILKLFDKLEEVIHDMAFKHNKLSQLAGEDIDNIEKKLIELQSKIDELSRMPNTLEAYSVRPADPDKIYRDSYMYLPRPSVEISPSGKIRITFGQEWTDLEKQNFLKDLRAKRINK